MNLILFYFILLYFTLPSSTSTTASSEIPYVAHFFFTLIVLFLCYMNCWYSPLPLSYTNCIFSKNGSLIPWRWRQHMLQNICNHIPDYTVSHHIHNLHKVTFPKTFMVLKKKKKKYLTYKKSMYRTYSWKYFTPFHDNETLKWEFKYTKTTESPSLPRQSLIFLLSIQSKKNYPKFNTKNLIKSLQNDTGLCKLCILGYKCVKKFLVSTESEGSAPTP